MSAVGAAQVDGRTIWWGKDVAWWRRDRIVALGVEFGPLGPAVIDWLWCEAKLQNAGGWVKSGAHAISHGIFADAVTVCHVVSRAVELGQLEEYIERDGVFTCRISGYASDDTRAQAAVRQQAARARKAANTGNPDRDTVTPSHGLSQPVTESHVKEEKRREEKNNCLTPSLRDGAANDPPDPDDAAPIPINRTDLDREQRIFDAWLHATGRTDSTVFDDKRRHTIRKALKLPQLTFDDVLAAARGVRHSDHHLQNRQWSELKVILRDVAQIEHFRDLERNSRGIPAHLDLADHPCAVDDATIDEWNQIIATVPEGVRVLLADSHPHAGGTDDAFLIGVQPNFAQSLAGKTRANALWLGAFTDGRPVEFLPCPQLERNAA